MPPVRRPSPTVSPDSAGRPAKTTASWSSRSSSLIVGTFYRASEPDARPFADVGDTVKRNQVLCIIEAMKLMNEIESEYDGEVVKVYVENGQPVQFGERLFAIKAT